jgi:hypothetical protein
MVVYLAGRVIHWLLTAATDPNVDPVSGAVLTKVAGPILTSAQFLIPAAVAISGIHKMMDHRESGGSFLVDMVTKGGRCGGSPRHGGPPSRHRRRQPGEP